jgi:hypothetical protein
MDISMSHTTTSADVALLEDSSINGELWLNLQSMDDPAAVPLATLRYTLDEAATHAPQGRLYVVDGWRPRVGDRLVLASGPVVMPIEIVDSPGTQGHFRFIHHSPLAEAADRTYPTS